MQLVLAVNGCAAIPVSLFPITKEKLSPVFQGRYRVNIRTSAGSDQRSLWPTLLTLTVASQWESWRLRYNGQYQFSRIPVLVLCCSRSSWVGTFWRHLVLLSLSSFFISLKIYFFPLLCNDCIPCNYIQNIWWHHVLKIYLSVYCSSGIKHILI